MLESLPQAQSLAESDARGFVRDERVRPALESNAFEDFGSGAAAGAIRGVEDLDLEVEPALRGKSPELDRRGEPADARAEDCDAQGGAGGSRCGHRIATQVAASAGTPRAAAGPSGERTAAA